MKIHIEQAKFDAKRFEAVVIGLFEGGKLPGGYLKRVDQSLDGAISNLLRRPEFKAEQNQTYLMYSQGKLKADRILLVGLGKRTEFNAETIRSTSGKAARQIRDLKLASYATLFQYNESALPITDAAQSVVEGAELALYSFERYKTKEKDQQRVKELAILVENRGHLAKVKEGVEVAQAIVKGVRVARDLANTPGRDCTPTVLAKEAAKIARKHRLKCKILEHNDLAQLGMGGILGVSSGSVQPAKVIVMEYSGGPKNQSPIILVGKGVTFDSGGISIKPSEKMDEMKFDKSGGTTVIGAIQTVAELGLPLNVVGIVPATENLLGAGAYKPGDVLTFYKGKTAEILNTDAEGRVILGDALSYSTDYKPQAIIDFATLTGACVIALGNAASGLVGNNDELKRRIVKAGETTGERVWELPLWKEYKQQIKSEIADIKNIGSRGGGAITAAAFLSEFVGDYPWAHLDIAGTAWTQESTPEKTYLPKGATGVGVRLVAQLLRDWKRISTNVRGKRGG